MEFDFSVAGWGCTNSAPVSVATIGSGPIAFASFQYYTDDATDFYFDLISDSGAGTTESFYYIGQSSAGGAPPADIPIVTGSWQHVIIPISAFTSQTFDVNNLFQFKFDVFAGATPGTVYVDNVLLSSVAPTLGTDEFDISDFNVFPNPSNTVWNIRSSNQNITSVQVFDILGKSVLSLTPNSTAVEIDGTGLKAGLYFARINSDAGTKSIKLVKQ